MVKVLVFDTPFSQADLDPIIQKLLARFEKKKEKADLDDTLLDAAIQVFYRLRMSCALDFTSCASAILEETSRRRLEAIAN